MANSVTLRQRKLRSGNVQLYLDCNVGGHRWTEGLGLSLKPGSDRATKEQNKQTMEIARTIERNRQEECILAASGIVKEKRNKVIFVDYYEQCANKRSGKTRESWYTALNHIKSYERRMISMDEIDKDWVQGFRYYLMTDAKRITNSRNGRAKNLSRNTAANIYSKLVACLHDALADELITKDPSCGVEGISIEEGEREYLTEEEVGMLFDTPCKKPEVRRAFLFSCMTGLRFGDIKSLRYANVRTIEGRKRIVYRQGKTREQMYLDLNDTAVELLDDGPEQSHVFTLGHNTEVNAILNDWVESAGIGKHITFHCARHTCATLLLTKGADIYTTSKILGHRKLQTTQIYAKVVDEKRRSAADLINIKKTE